MRIDLTNIHINLYRLLPLGVIFWPVGNAVADYSLSSLFSQSDNVTAAIEEDYLSEGDEVGGYKVTSEYDMERLHPTDGNVQPHYGIDIATPTGTKLIAPTYIEVNCWWDNKGGGLVADVAPDTGESVRLLHLSYCTKGKHAPGDSFALSGATGKGTGAHLDIRRQDKTEPTKGDIEPYLTGKLPAVILADADLNVSDIEERELSDIDLVCSIGAAEGTRDQNCKPTKHYDSHTDPGNGVTNQGSFSYQHGATSPKDADEKQLARLRRAEAGLQAQATVKFGRELSTPALAAALDLWNQAPAAGEDFVSHLTTATPTGEQIVEARAKSYVNPATGRLDAPGLGNDTEKVAADQERRTGEVIYQLEKQHSTTQNKKEN